MNISEGLLDSKKLGEVSLSCHTGCTAHVEYCPDCNWHKIKCTCGFIDVKCRCEAKTANQVAKPLVEDLLSYLSAPTRG